MSVAVLKTNPAADQTILVEGTVRAPIARVWQAWTRIEDLKQWFGRAPGSVTEGECDVRVGGRWRLAFSDADEGGHLEGEYVTVEPEAQLAFTWRHVGGDGMTSPQSQVTVTFTAQAESTHLSIRHEGVQALSSRENISHGWSDCINNLTALLTTPL